MPIQFNSGWRKPSKCRTYERKSNGHSLATTSIYVNIALVRPYKFQTHQTNLVHMKSKRVYRKLFFFPEFKYRNDTDSVERHSTNMSVRCVLVCDVCRILEHSHSSLSIPCGVWLHWRCTNTRKKWWLHYSTHIHNPQYGIFVYLS